MLPCWSTATPAGALKKPAGVGSPASTCQLPGSGLGALGVGAAAAVGNWSPVGVIGTDVAGAATSAVGVILTSTVVVTRLSASAAAATSVSARTLPTATHTAVKFVRE